MGFSHDSFSLLNSNSSKDPASPGSDPKKPKLPSLEPDDPEIDSLTKLLDRSLALQTRALAASKLVAVDKNYSLASATTPSQFYKWRADAKRINKRKREEGILSNYTEGNRIGFQPEELILNGALDMKDCRPSNLTNEIHSLFGRNRFDDCPDYIYDQFIPALRLATLFLTKPICFQFWVTVGLGTRKFDEEGSRRCGYATERIEENVPMTEENTSCLIDYIQELDQSTLVHFGFKPALTMGGIQVWAVAQEICDYYVEKPRRPFTAIRRHNVRLHGDFYIAAQRSAQLGHPDPAQQLRFHFFLAVVLVHELAHVVEGAHRQVQSGANPMLEPFLFDHTIKEMGAAWESVMFGGRIQPINGRVDGSDGLTVNDWPGVDDLDEGSYRRIFYSIPMGYIESMFQMQNWELKHNLQNWEQLHIPRTGAVGIYLNCFTTMPWEEEVHEITSIVAEDLTLSNPDEPARKRRETRTGSPGIVTKSHREQRKPDHHPKATKPVVLRRPKFKRAANLSAAVIRRNFEGMKVKHTKVKAKKHKQALEKSKKVEAIHKTTDKPQEPNRQSIQQPSENSGEKISTQKKQASQASMNANLEELFHPRIRGFKRSANAERFRPANWPWLRSRVGKYVTIESGDALDPVKETSNE